MLKIDFVFKVLGMGEEWKGGDMSKPGGGFKINLLKEELANHRDDKNLIVVFTDSYDVLLVSILLNFSLLRLITLQQNKLVRLNKLGFHSPAWCSA